MRSRIEALSCRDATRLVTLYLGAQLGRRPTQRLRAHLAGCAECMEHYRASVHLTASIGRSRTTDRRTVQRALRKHRFARIAAGLNGRGKSPFWQLRLVLYPALLLLLVTQVVRKTVSAGADCLQVAGEVHVGIEALEDGARAPLFPGAWCRTEAGGSAQLSGAIAAGLGTDTAVLIESLTPPRVRLASGELELSGAARVSTALGIVTLEAGDAQVSLRAGVLTVATRDGQVRFLGPDGARDVAPGRPLTVTE